MDRRLIRGPLARGAHRALHALGRLRHRLPLHGESVWDGARTDLFVAHLAVYELCSRWAAGRRVLDAGCGTGYGSDHLARRGAREVVGVDRSSGSIRYAARRYGREGVRFLAGDLERVDEHVDGPFDLIVASNVIEHLARPETFLRRAQHLLAPAGELAVVVPAIVDEHSLELNRRNPFHLTNLPVADWVALVSRLGLAHRLYRQVFTGPVPDFSSPLPSRLELDDFRFLESDLEAVYREPCLGVLLRLRPAPAGPPG